MLQIGILGFGTVGSGVYETLEINSSAIKQKAAVCINVKRIFDIRKFPGSEFESKLTDDINDVLNDDEIKVVVEVMGGVEPAYTYVKRALENGKSVVTSNKELVAKHGAALLELSRKLNVNFLFEASVGGGIPIIRPLNQSLTADKITEITGILNGTSNYILTEMSEENKSFGEALKEAQEKGFAERDPSADIEGYDTCRKIAILLSLAIGRQVNFEDIYTEGITKITTTDMAYADAYGYSIKLLAIAKIEGHEVYAKTVPAMIEKDHILSGVKGVHNAIMVKGNYMGTILFYGEGAGKFPTASAVVADIVDCAKHMNTHIMHDWSVENFDISPIENAIVKAFIRVEYKEKKEAEKAVSDIFSELKPLEIDNVVNEFGFITNEYTEKELSEKVELLKESDWVDNILSLVRLY